MNKSESLYHTLLSLSLSLGVKAAIVADVTILRFLSWLVETVPGTENFSLVDCVEEFSSLMMLQLDMKLEADNLDRFRHNFKLSKETQTHTQPATSLFDSVLESISSIVQKSVSVIAVPKGKVTFPQPVWPYVTTSVLVETYEPGRQISDILDELTNKKLRKEIATAGLDAILKMVFEDNFIHAGK